MDDDRAEFDAERRRQALELASDDVLRRDALDVFARADALVYSYVWTWLGLPVIQVPADIVVMQEIIWNHRPQLIIETGVARGGSVILYASILQLIGEGTVLGIDVEIRSHNRHAIEQHPLSHRIQLLQGSSIDPATIAAARTAAADVHRTMVVLDSNHTHEHVFAELEAYADLVTPGQFLVVADTVVEDLPIQHHRPRPWGPGDNPATAVAAFLAGRADFAQDPETNGKLLMTSSPGGYLRRAEDP